MIIQLWRPAGQLHLKARLIQITAASAVGALPAVMQSAHQYGSLVDNQPKGSRARLPHWAEMPVSRTAYVPKGSG